MNDLILLSHGSGGESMRKLIEFEFLRYFSNPILDELLDSGVFELSGTLAMTTDSYVINPIFFKNGDIGKLSVFGTLNDLCVVGAKPLFLSLSFIFEEGFPIQDLKKILNSISIAANSASVKIITGDTKVVEKNKGDKVFINTAGIGIIEKHRDWRNRKIQEGDLVIVSGSIGEHGLYIMLERLGVETDEEVCSDLANMTDIILGMLDNFNEVKFVRDATRGGVATVLNEISQKYHVEVEVYEEELPIKEWVKNASEVLGIDPLYAANEGKAVIVASPTQAPKIIQYLQQFDISKDARIIGKIKGFQKNKTYLITRLGTRRILESLKGDILPRIC
ncbi:MAG: hydrogenase expression/formation protein HypE [Candidatus Calescibacterium sp.]|nr:hydrogenase expression/formation protein HypE [Candidatus Calescibacterium sp.]MCX7972001.1 hydrogenase expression/formation protein HypE [bacterium]MDW8195489.1 hydrogenase expression/formation protein HypE [Candidatus Calescibacterium sp.]